MTDDPNKKQNDPNQSSGQTTQKQEHQSGAGQGIDQNRSSQQDNSRKDQQHDQQKDQGGQRKAS